MGLITTKINTNSLKIKREEGIVKQRGLPLDTIGNHHSSTSSAVEMINHSSTVAL